MTLVPYHLAILSSGHLVTESTISMLKKLLIIVITLVIPFLLVVASIRIVANPWFIQVEYNRAGFPPDPYGFTLEQRIPLGFAGLYSVVPEGAGMIELEQARLPNGEHAFQTREIKHMLDVRVLIAKVFPLALISGALLVVLAVVFRKNVRYRDVIPQGLGAGSILTLVLLVGLQEGPNRVSLARSLSATGGVHESRIVALAW